MFRCLVLFIFFHKPIYLLNILKLVLFDMEIKQLTLAAPRGIGVTLNPKGGPKRPYKKHRLYELAQMFSAY